MNNILVTALMGRGWVHASVLCAELGLNRRQLRDLAHASYGHIISGDAGYCITVDADHADVRNCVARLCSQAVAMQERADQISKVYAAVCTEPVTIHEAIKAAFGGAA